MAEPARPTPQRSATPTPRPSPPLSLPPPPPAAVTTTSDDDGKDAHRSSPLLSHHHHHQNHKQLLPSPLRSLLALEDPRPPTASLSYRILLAVLAFLLLAALLSAPSLWFRLNAPYLCQKDHATLPSDEGTPLAVGEPACCHRILEALWRASQK